MAIARVRRLVLQVRFCDDPPTGSFLPTRRIADPYIALQPTPLRPVHSIFLQEKNRRCARATVHAPHHWLLSRSPSPVDIWRRSGIGLPTEIQKQLSRDIRPGPRRL